ncbi:hypothetical protein VDG1235_383 [Verrucomicrobiia bacterium DG1235]|nr:hypothetical protein VDG1235_383 [Verrucomicrobiae bacterium DG1235]
MNKLTRILNTLLALSALISANSLSADTLKTGDAFPEFEANDQHEKAYPMPSDTKYVAVTFAMGSGKKANKFFSEKGANYLTKNKAVFLSNIYGMPAVGRFFAIPKMQKYPHRIMLADQEGLLDDFPQEKGKVTILELDAGGKILSIKFWDPSEGNQPF